MNKVFVYGTLLSGEPNNGLLSESKLVGNAEVVGFDMYSLGGFPACVENTEAETPVVGEVWEVTDNELTRLDRLEGYPSFYDRVQVETDFGDAWIYTLNRAANGENALVENGDWKQYVRGT